MFNTARECKHPARGHKPLLTAPKKSNQKKIIRYVSNALEIPSTLL